jgi:hypothetical protein
VSTRRPHKTATGQSRRGGLEVFAGGASAGHPCKATYPKAPNTHPASLGTVAAKQRQQYNKALKGRSRPKGA